MLKEAIEVQTAYFNDTYLTVERVDDGFILNVLKNGSCYRIKSEHMENLANYVMGIENPHGCKERLFLVGNGVGEGLRTALRKKNFANENFACVDYHFLDLDVMI